jgi:ketosteroid isomerase-like protein
MAEESLEARIAALELEYRTLTDIEAIRTLRYKYCRSVNRAEWRNLEECFAEDATFEFGPGTRVSGRTAVIEFYENVLSRTMAMTVIHCHNPEIEVRGDKGSGLWEFDNFRIESRGDEASRIGGRYEEEYIKVDGQWKIRSSAVTFHFQQPTEWRAVPG